MTEHSMNQLHKNNRNICHFRVEKERASEIIGGKVTRAKVLPSGKTCQEDGS
jgi:hypothetical protein